MDKPRSLNKNWHHKNQQNDMIGELDVNFIGKH